MSASSIGFSTTDSGPVALAADASSLTGAPDAGVPARAPGDAAHAPVAPARPQNNARSLFHVGSAALALALLHWLPSRGWLVAVAAAFCLSGWTMEIARRKSVAANRVLMALFAPVAHAHERHGINSATWYCTALLLLGLFAPIRAAEIGVIVLGLADPAAGFIGRRFGRTRLRANRSVEGSLGFVVVGALAAGAWLMFVHALPLPTIVLLAGVAAVVGALTELGSTRLDDNFTIPVTVALAVGIAQTFVAA